MQSPWPEQSRGQTPAEEIYYDDQDQDDDDDDDADDECHGGDDLACFECATVSDETSLDLPQKRAFHLTQEGNSQRAYLQLTY